MRQSPQDIGLGPLDEYELRVDKENEELRAALKDCSQWLAAFAKGAGYHTHKTLMESPRWAKIQAALKTEG